MVVIFICNRSPVKGVYPSPIFPVTEVVTSHWANKFLAFRDSVFDNRISYAWFSVAVNTNTPVNQFWVVFVLYPPLGVTSWVFIDNDTCQGVSPSTWHFKGLWNIFWHAIRPNCRELDSNCLVFVEFCVISFVSDSDSCSIGSWICYQSPYNFAPSGNVSWASLLNFEGTWHCINNGVAILQGYAVWNFVTWGNIEFTFPVFSVIFNRVSVNGKASSQLILSWLNLCLWEMLFWLCLWISCCSWFSFFGRRLLFFLPVLCCRLDCFCCRWCYWCCRILRKSRKWANKDL